jgi:hypothetical protein
LIAVCERGREEVVRGAMSHALEAATAQSAIAFVLEPDYGGVQITRIP